MDADLWKTINSILGFLSVSSLTVFTYFLRKYIHRIESTEQQVKDIEVRTAVVESKIDDIREDLREIKYGVNRLIDRRVDNKKDAK